MFNTIISTGLTAQNLAICSLVSIVCGLIIAFTHTRTTTFSKNFAITLVSLPVLVQAVMMMVNGNLGTGVAIMGAFGLVRFRSLPGTSREIVSVFFAMAIIKPQTIETSEQIAKFCAVSPVEIIELNIFTP